MAEFNLMSTLIIAVIITAIIAPFIALMFKKKSDKWMPFIARPIEKIYTNGLDDKIKIQGKKLKGARIVHGWDNRNRIDKFYTTKGKMPQFDYDDTTKEYTLIKKKKDPKNKKGDNKKKDDEFQSIEFDFTVFRLKNKSLLWRLFGFKKSYMIIRNKDDNGKKIIKKDDRFNRFFLLNLYFSFFFLFYFYLRLLLRFFFKFNFNLFFLLCILNTDCVPIIIFHFIILPLFTKQTTYVKILYILYYTIKLTICQVRTSNRYFSLILAHPPIRDLQDE